MNLSEDEKLSAIISFEIISIGNMRVLIFCKESQLHHEHLSNQDCLGHNAVVYSKNKT